MNKTPESMRWNFITRNLILLMIGITWMPVNISAQVEGMAMPSDGYVILRNGDSLYGRITWRLKYVENNPVEIKFTPVNGSTMIYNASEISGFDDYVSMPSFKKGVPVFLNRLLDGRIKVFQNRSSAIITNDKVETTTEYDGLEFRYSREDGLTIGPRFITSSRVIESRTRYSSYFVTKDNGALQKIEKENFESVFSTLFGDCQAIQQELIRNPDLEKFKNFMLLVEIYNNLCLK
jgi:hypothetical protein